MVTGKIGSWQSFLFVSRGMRGDLSDVRRSKILVRQGVAVAYCQADMPAKTTPARQPEAVTQFSVFTPNRLGRLHDLVGTLAAHRAHVLALTVLDTADSAGTRFVVWAAQRGPGVTAP